MDALLIVDELARRFDLVVATRIASARATRRFTIPVTVIEDAIRAVDVPPGDGKRALDEVASAGARLASAADVIASGHQASRG